MRINAGTTNANTNHSGLDIQATPDGALRVSILLAEEQAGAATVQLDREAALELHFQLASWLARPNGPYASTRRIGFGTPN